MQPKQSGIHLRKEIFSQKIKQPQRKQTESQKANHEQPAVFQSGFQKPLISPAEVFKFALKASLKPPQRRLRCLLAMLMPPHDVHHQRRNQRS